MCIRDSTHFHKHIHIHTHIHTHTHTRTYSHTNTHIHIHTYTQTYTHILTHKHTHSHISTHIYQIRNLSIFNIIGVFVQLVPVKQYEEDMEYILIMDTEGLRSPEFIGTGNFTQDNELATFVSCLANTTILNFRKAIQKLLKITLNL